MVGGLPQAGSFVAMPSTYGGASYGGYGGASYGGYGGYSSYGGYPAQTMSYAQPSYGYTQQSYATTPSYGTTMPATSNFGNPLMAYVPGGGAYAPTDDKPAAAPVKRAVKKGAKGGSCCC